MKESAGHYSGEIFLSDQAMRLIKETGGRDFRH